MCPLLHTVFRQALTVLNDFVRDKLLTLQAQRRQLVRQRVSEQGAVDVRAFGLREKALWDEANHLRDFAEINYTGGCWQDW